MIHLINRKRFILENIETLVQTHLSPACIDETLKQQPLSEQLHMLRTESCEAIRLLKCFQYEIPASDFQRLCQQNYSDLFCMKDRLNLLQASFGYKSMSEDALAFYEMLSYEIDRVEEALHSLGICSLAPHEQLPDHYRDCRKALLWQQSLLLFGKLISKSADPGLMVLLRSRVDGFMAANRILQHELDFAEQLIATLFKLFDVPGEVEEDLLIMNTLVCLNFNSGAAYHYCRERIKLELIECNGSKRKFQALSWHLKELKQMLPLSGLALNPAYPELKVLLLELVQAEISYLGYPVPDLEIPVKTIHEPRRGTHIPPGRDRDKIQLQVSQQVLAMWVRTMISMELIQLGAITQRELTELLAKHFTTSGSEDIIPHSFRRRYKEKHTSASETFITILEQMIVNIKAEYIDIKVPPKK